MPIVFAENFEQDTPTSIVQRYPGSVRNTPPTDLTNAWPLFDANGVFSTAMPIFNPAVNKRFECVIGFQNALEGSRFATSFSFFGMPLSTTSASMTLCGLTVSGLTSILQQAQQWNIVVDTEDSTLTWFIDGEPLLNKQVATMPTWTDKITKANGGLPLLVPSHIKSVVVAYDNPAGTMMRNVAFVKRTLSVVDAGGWSYTTDGLVQDVSKSDPLQRTPAITLTTTEGTIQYNAAAVPNTKLTRVYTSAHSEKTDALQVDVNGSRAALLAGFTETPKVSPPLDITGDTVSVHVGDVVGDFEAILNITTAPTTLSPRFSEGFTGTILWGDGTSTEVTAGTRVDHVYNTTGEVKVKMVGKVTGTMTFAHPMLTEVVRWDTIGMNNITFYKGLVTGDPELVSSALVKVPSSLPTSIKSLYTMFIRVPAFVGTELSAWDVSRITIFSSAFQDATAFNGDISGWDLRNATATAAMFYGATAFNRNIGLWDVSNVSNMSQMFGGATVFNQDLSLWCVSLIPTAPSLFDLNTPAWVKTNRQPVWGTCPART